MIRLLRMGYRLMVVVVPVFLLLPFVGVLLASLSVDGTLNFPPSALSFKWYRSIDPSYVEALTYSLKLGALTTMLVVLTGVPAALAIARADFRGKAALNALCISPLAVPVIVIAVAGFKFLTTLGDHVDIGLTGSSTGIVVLQAVYTFPLLLRTVLASFAHFDLSLEEAAQNLGARPWQVFRHVTLPIITPGILAGMVFAFVLAFDEVVVAWFLGDPAYPTLPVKLFTSMEVEFDNAMTALSTLIVLAWAAFALVLSRVSQLGRFLVSR